MKCGFPHIYGHLQEDYVLETFDNKCGLQKTPPCPCGDNKQNFVSADRIEQLLLEVTNNCRSQVFYAKNRILMKK